MTFQLALARSFRCSRLCTPGPPLTDTLHSLSPVPAPVSFNGSSACAARQALIAITKPGINFFIVLVPTPMTRYPPGLVTIRRNSFRAAEGRSVRPDATFRDQKPTDSLNLQPPTLKPA